MTDNGNGLRVSWRDLCPWLLIFRSFGLSISIHVLFLATVGALLTPVGWWVAGLPFDRDTTDSSFLRVVDSNSRCPCLPPIHHVEATVTDFPAPDASVHVPYFSFPVLWYQRFIEPFRMQFDTEVTLPKFAYLLFGGLWTLAVWAFFGGAITRIATVQLGRDERVGLKDALGYSCRKFWSYFAGPVLPLLAVFIVGLPTMVLGLFMMADWGVAFASVFWILALLGGFIMAAILLGLTFGWPLMWGTISAEGTDAFDGLSRAYAYTFQRPLHYFFYVAVAAVFGLLCWTLVFLFSESIIALTFWAASWGSNISETIAAERDGIARIQQIQAAANNPTLDDDPAITMFGPHVIYWCNGLVRVIATAFTYSYFWCVFSAIYLLLRRDVDQTEFDEVWLEDNDDRYGLPPIKPDPAGVPELAERRSADKDKSESEAQADGDSDTDHSTPSDNDESD